MNDYLDQLEFSSLPFPPWAAALLWLTIFTLSHWLFRRTRALALAQPFLQIGTPAVVLRSASPKAIVSQLLFASAIFAYANWAGGHALTYLVGGWVVTTSASMAVNLHGLLFVRALAKPGAATGALTLSNPLVARDNAYYFFGAAAFCLVLGLLVAHPALLSGALFIACTGLSLLLRANKR